MNTPTEIKSRHYAKMQPRIKGQKKLLLALYERATTRGIKTKAGEVIYALTDMEAAKMLGWERSTVNGRRNELVADCLVEQAGQRRCNVTGRTVTTWRIQLQRSMFDNAKDMEVVK